MPISGDGKMRDAVSVDDVLPRLVCEYDAGRLVPFLGAGMSRKVCPDWEGFIHELETLAGLGRDDDDDDDGKLVNTADTLTRRGMRAVRLLRREDPDRFVDAISRALKYEPGVECPPQTNALAKIWWPLVLTTNYDDLFLKQVTKEQDEPNWQKEYNDEPRIPSTLVLGRSSDDCHAVLRSLREPGRSVLWALHGFLRKNPSRGEPVERYQRLATELVIGHEEYRRIVHTAVHFRRAFAEVFRDRSFLFLGSSLKDPHLTGLFDEILEIAGPNPRPHYAVVLGGQDMPDAHFFKTRLNTVLIQVDDYNAIPDFLGKLKEKLDARRPRMCTWAYSMHAQAKFADGESGGVLRITRGGLPHHLNDKECIAISAGVQGRQLQIGEGMRSFLSNFWPSGAGNPATATDAAGDNGKGETATRKNIAAAATATAMAVTAVAKAIQTPALPGDKHVRVVQHGKLPCFYAAARDRTEKSERRDLRVIGDTVVQLLDQAHAAGYTTVHSQLLAAGYRRTVPPVFHLIEMARGFGRWWDEHIKQADGESPSPMQLAIHIVDPDVLFALENNRVDMSSILSSNDVRFWVDVSERGQVAEMRVVTRGPNTLLEDLADELDIPKRGWEVLVRPAPDGFPEPLPLGTAFRRGETLKSLGVVPHCVVLFRRGST